jgi:phospholipid/cholesterol/gamma-HCH transport system substrate-binding protein
VKGLDGIVKAPGAANDLIELTELQVPLAEIGVGPVNRNGASRQGALPESAEALEGSLPQLSFLRPYLTTEAMTGWFDDFGHSGYYDTIGGIGRISTTLNPFTLGIPGFPNLPDLGLPIDLTGITDIGGLLGALPGLSAGNLQRCPGSNERGVDADQLTQGGTINCDPSIVPIGP